MKQINVKKLLLPNLPYVFIALFATKLGQAARLAPGADFSQKALHIMEGFAAAFQSALPSFHPIDLCVGIAAALLIRLAVYVKGKNARKFRKNIEYGSARWGNAEDIKPYVDPTFANNVILTQTERLTMNSRPKDPKTARNKNVLVVGGSGSGKTRFFIKPNLMQLHSSYVVTDPKGSIVVECGKLLQRNQYKIKICFGNECITEQQMLDACRKARCHDFVSALPEGYDTVVGEGGATLSGGERQRISLARAFLKDVPILLLDEPTASLDADNEAMVQRALDEISKERTIIMIAHRLKTVRGAQQILVLENGRITQKGTHNQLVGTDGLYSRLWELQNQAGNYTFKQS